MQPEHVFQAASPMQQGSKVYVAGHRGLVGSAIVYLAGLLTAYVVGFIAAWLLGFEDPEEE